MMQVRSRTILLGVVLSSLVVVTLAGCRPFKFPLRRRHHDQQVRLNDAPATLPGKYSQRVSQFVFVSDFELKTDQPLFKELTDLRERVVRELGLPNPTALIHVYLFEERDRYQRYMHVRYPELPERRAFFVAQPRNSGNGDDLIVYTFLGDHLRQDLRHELTHALLHSVLKDVPLWLDEGLAEYYELPTESRGVNRIHLASYQKEGLRPNLARLELLSQVQQMNQAEYREAWAWVHLIMHGRPESRQALVSYLKQLRFNATPGAIQPRLQACYDDLEAALLAHLGTLR
jgi:hypothetical protein